jgi:hypothetical protein
MPEDAYYMKYIISSIAGILLLYGLQYLFAYLQKKKLQEKMETKNGDTK